MTTLITADLHLTDNPRDAYRHRFMQKTLPNLIKMHQVDKLLILGDLTEEKDRHAAELVNKITDHFWSLSKRCEVCILRGNHDGLDPLNPFFAFLRHFEGISWINNPTSVGKWLFLPHTGNYKKDWEGLNFKDHTLIFAHNTFQNAAGESGHKLDGIPLNTFPKGTHVIAGDIHVPQTLTESRTKITYVGAPYPIDFGNDYKPRVLLIKDAQTKSIEVLGVSKLMADIERLAELNNLKWKAGDLLKVRMKLDPKNYARVSEYERRVAAWAIRRDLTLCGFTTITPTGLTSYVSPNLPRASLTDEQVMTTYAKQRGIAKHTLKRGLTLMERMK